MRSLPYGFAKAGGSVDPLDSGQLREHRHAPNPGTVQGHAPHIDLRPGADRPCSPGVGDKTFSCGNRSASEGQTLPGRRVLRGSGDDQMKEEEDFSTTYIPEQEIRLTI